MWFNSRLVLLRALETHPSQPDNGYIRYQGFNPIAWSTVWAVAFKGSPGMLGREIRIGTALHLARVLPTRDHKIKENRFWV